MNDPDLFFLHALLCGEQGRRPVFPAKEAAERAFAPRPWEEIVELFQRPVSCVITILCIIALVISLYSAIKEKRDQLGDE